MATEPRQQLPDTNTPSRHRALLLSGLPVTEREFGISPIPPDDLARIAVPTMLIWGRHDRANRLRIAQDASARHGWPLHVIENCADDPPRDQPLVFLEALRMALGTEKRQQVTA
jgi:pimeloyl-ACP methyl ester carboxylesterase